MNINTTITDLQASSLAASLHVSGYKDGNELIAKCAAAAELRVSKQALIQAIAVSAVPAPVDSATVAFEATIGTKIPRPSFSTAANGAD